MFYTSRAFYKFWVLRLDLPNFFYSGHFPRWPPRSRRVQVVFQYLGLQGSQKPNFGVYTYVYDAKESNKQDYRGKIGSIHINAVILHRKGHKIANPLLYKAACVCSGFWVLGSDFICSAISSVTRQRKTMKFCISTQNKLIQALA